MLFWDQFLVQVAPTWITQNFLYPPFFGHNMAQPILKIHDYKNKVSRVESSGTLWFQTSKYMKSGTIQESY